MAELTDEEYEAARERGRVEFETKPHARTARYDRDAGMVVVELYNGCVFSFPPRQLQGLENASDAELASVEVIGIGYGLHWEPLDADFTVHGLMEGRFGTAKYMAPLRARLRSLMEEISQPQRAAA